MGFLRGLKSKTTRFILNLFYRDWCILWNHKTSMEAICHLTSDYKAFIIEHCHILGFQDTAIKVESGPTNSYIVDVYAERIGQTKIVPKPKSFEHNARRGMMWLFKSSGL